MTPEERKKYALRWVNERRKEGGLRGTSRLTKGYKGSAILCTIAKSLEKVGVYSADYGGDEVSLTGLNGKEEEVVRAWQDPELARFMEEFDAGEYPELVIDPTPIKIGKVVVG